jgi:hypothetical protein
MHTLSQEVPMEQIKKILETALWVTIGFYFGAWVFWPFMTGA